MGIEQKKKRRGRSASPAKVIALGFLSVILAGGLLLSLPISATKGTIPPLDALFTATSAVCVTGLSTISVGWDLSPFGQAVMLLLMQIGGLGITTIGIGVISFSRKKISQRESLIIKEAINYPSFRQIGPMVRSLLLVTVVTEAAGALLSFFVFRRDFGVGEAVWLSVFHSVAAFNNAGFDLLGDGQSLVRYAADPLMNGLTAALIILGSLGFFVMRDMAEKRTRVRKYTLHTKVALTMTILLLSGGTLLLKLTDGAMTWMEAFFASVTARTAGFATYPCSSLTNGGLIVMMILMFIGASPGSTGGGMKTTTFYVLIQSLRATVRGGEPQGFRKKLPREVVEKASLILSFGLIILILVTAALAVLEPAMGFRDLLFEVVSAIATVGLSTGITSGFCAGSKLLLIAAMFIGRLGPLTIATMWADTRETTISRAEESLPVG